MKNKVYILKRDFSHLFDMDEDAALLPFKGSDSIDYRMQGIQKFEIPDVLYFESNFEIIPEIDYPILDVCSVFVISTRMYELLIEVGEFKHLIISVTMLDDSYSKNHFESNGTLKKEVTFNDKYVAVQFLEYTEAFDYEESEYSMGLAFPEEIGIISKIVLKNKQYPPVFRIEESTEYIFITEEAKNKLLENGIKGCIFEEVEVSD